MRGWRPEGRSAAHARAEDTRSTPAGRGLVVSRAQRHPANRLYRHPHARLSGGRHHPAHVARGVRFKASRAETLFLYRDNGLAAFDMTPGRVRVNYLA